MKHEHVFQDLNFLYTFFLKARIKSFRPNESFVNITGAKF